MTDIISITVSIILFLIGLWIGRNDIVIRVGQQKRMPQKFCGMEVYER